MGETKDRAIRHLESIINRDKDSVNYYLSLSGQKPLREKNEDEPRQDYLTQTMTRGTRGGN